MKWNNLTELQQLDELIAKSEHQVVLIFKHSTRCSISAMAKSRLENRWNTSLIKPYYLDLLSYRKISDSIAEKFGIEHQSPQTILLHKRKVVHYASHNAIDYADILRHGKIT